jgi:hypothetical protein
LTFNGLQGVRSQKRVQYSSNKDSVHRAEIATCFPIISEQLRNYYEHFKILAGIQNTSDNTKAEVPKFYPAKFMMMMMMMMMISLFQESEYALSLSASV